MNKKDLERRRKLALTRKRRLALARKRKSSHRSAAAPSASRTGAASTKISKNYTVRIVRTVQDGRIVEVLVVGPMNEKVSRPGIERAIREAIEHEGAGGRVAASEHIIARRYLEPAGRSEVGVKRIRDAVKSVTLDSTRNLGKSR